MRVCDAAAEPVTIVARRGERSAGAPVQRQGRGRQEPVVRRAEEKERHSGGRGKTGLYRGESSQSQQKPL